MPGALPEASSKRRSSTTKRLNPLTVHNYLKGPSVPGQQYVYAPLYAASSFDMNGPSGLAPNSVASFPTSGWPTGLSTAVFFPSTSRFASDSATGSLRLASVSVKVSPAAARPIYRGNYQSLPGRDRSRSPIKPQTCWTNSLDDSIWSDSNNSRERKKIGLAIDIREEKRQGCGNGVQWMGCERWSDEDVEMMDESW